MEKGFRPALQDAGLADKVRLTSADDLLHWFDSLAPASIKKEMEEFVLKETKLPWATYLQQEGVEATARWISRYCDEHAIRPQIAAGLKERLAYIYRQITSVGSPRYTGLLLVIDEYEGWARNRPSPEAQSQDGELLETLAHLLPKELGLQVHTIVASQTDVPAKLLGAHEGDRFIRIPLLADRNARDYDVIISRRVRGLREDRLPEINDHCSFYRGNFEFARGLSQGEFADMFPFQPRCFEVVRRITARELPTARSGILIFHEVVNHPELLARDALIRVCDLLKSDHLSKDCLTTTVYRDAHNAYRIAQEALPTLGVDTEDLPLAEDVLATLFLWHLAYMERPISMTLRDLAQATLTQDAFLKAEDNVLLVLNQMQALSQVTFDGKEARFEPKGIVGVQVNALFNEQVKKVKGDAYRVRTEWSNSLFLSAQATRGQAGLFSDFSPDESVSRRVTFGNLEYPGEVLVGSRWKPDWQSPLPKEDVHFRLVVLTPEAAESVKASDLQDRRIAAIYPGELSEEVLQTAARYLAWKEMDKRYRNETGKEAEAIREWLDTQRPTCLNALLQTHLPVYRTGKVITQSDLGINARDVFNQMSNEQRLRFIVEKVLAAAYDQLPLNASALRSTLTAAEVGKVCDGYFGASPNTAQTAALRNYGLGLKLSHPDQPARFAPQADCKVFEIIRAMIEERKGAELAVWRIYERLSTPPYGLPYVVIQLYVLAFLRHGDPRVELTLKRDHKLKMRDGKSLTRDRLNAATVIELDWRPGIERAFDVLMPLGPGGWNDAVPYARELVNDLHTSADQLDIEAQTARLQTALVTLDKEIHDSRDALGTLERSLSGTLGDDDREALAQLEKLSTGSETGHTAFYEQSQALFATPDALRDTLRAHSRLRDLASQAAEINEMKRYLEATSLRAEDRNLAADRDSLLAQLSLPSLEAQPGLWSGLQANFQQFKARYHNEYLKHHRDTNEALQELAQTLAAAPPQLRALALLNKVEELGEPRGEGLEAQHERLRRCVQPCPVSNYLEVNTDAAPVCARCERKLTNGAPVEEVQGFLRALEGALGDQRRRLASEAIRRVLARSQESAVSRFVQVVQTANVAALVDVLDDKLVELIRELLAEDQVATVQCDLLRRFAQEYSTLEEADIPKAVARFSQLLHEYFAEARRSNVDKKAVRLTLR